MLRICLQTTTQMAPAAPPPVLRRIWHVDPPDFAEADDDWCFMGEEGEEGHDNPFYRMLVEHINKTSGLVSDEALCKTSTTASSAPSGAARLDQVQVEK